MEKLVNSESESTIKSGLLSQLGGLRYVAILALFILGIGLRIVDITDPPLDFHPWRQLRAASIARAKYYKMTPSLNPDKRQTAIELAEDFEVLEPRIFETIVAFSYKVVGGEHLWIARLYAILFWTIGGIALFSLARRLTSEDGAIVSLAFYLFTPFGFAGSREFLPEPLMIMLIMLALYSLSRFGEERSWKWSICTGLLSGAAIHVKIFAIFPIAIATVFFVITVWGFKQAIKEPKVWVTALLTLTIPAPYYLLGLSGSYTGSEYLSYWSFRFSKLLLQPGFYVQWMTVLQDLVGLLVVFPSLMGAILFPPRGKALSIGLWVGYLLLGMCVPSLILSHTYYSLLLVPTIALSLAPLGNLLFSKFITQPRIWQFSFAGIALLSLSSPIVYNYKSVMARDYRPEIIGWEELGNELPEGTFIGITHDYNNRLNYYGWRKVTQWPHASDIGTDIISGAITIQDNPDWHEIFLQKTQGYDYFIVTLFGELDLQPVLRETLYQNYEIIAADDRYIVFDLNSKKE